MWRLTETIGDMEIDGKTIIVAGDGSDLLLY
jgi:hypothetical protein